MESFPVIGSALLLLILLHNQIFTIIRAAKKKNSAQCETNRKNTEKWYIWRNSIYGQIVYDAMALFRTFII